MNQKIDPEEAFKNRQTNFFVLYLAIGAALGYAGWHITLWAVEAYGPGKVLAGIVAFLAFRMMLR